MVIFAILYVNYNYSFAKNKVVLCECNKDVTKIINNNKRNKESAV